LDKKDDAAVESRIESGKITVKNGQMKKSLVVAFSAISVALLVAVITLSVLLAQSHGKLESSKSNICTTRACIKASNLILSNIDPSVDPCEDFNEFSCGQFKKRRIPSDATSTDVFSDLRAALSLAVAGKKRINFFKKRS
jgi:hypothetical protein